MRLSKAQVSRRLGALIVLGACAGAVTWLVGLGGYRSDRAARAALLRAITEAKG